MVLTADAVGDHGFTESSPHRADLPAVYNAYARARPDGAGSAEEDRQTLFRPLFATSFLIDDLLDDRGLLEDSRSCCPARRARPPSGRRSCCRAAARPEWSG